MAVKQSFAYCSHGPEDVSIQGVKPIRSPGGNQVKFDAELNCQESSVIRQTNYITI
jgi:hypothetical protein